MDDTGIAPAKQTYDGVPLAIRPMAAADIDRGMILKQAAGWNQTEADWFRFLALEPGGCFVATVDDLVIGTIASCRFHHVAWIGMMLIDQRFRRNGVATRLLKYVLAKLDQERVQSIRLDSTPLGLSLYKKLGFQSQFRVVRFGGVPQMTNCTTSLVRVVPYQANHLTDVLDLDRQTTQIDRTKLIQSLLSENASRARVVESPQGLAGYVIERSGSDAIQVGPVMASSDEVGRSLILDVMQRHANERCYIDVPESNEIANSLMDSLQLQPLREFTRMCRGQLCCERSEQLWAGSGPEKG